MARRIIEAVLLVALAACTKDKGRLPDTSGYPEEVGRIMSGSCAVTGCHTPSGKEAAGGLSLSSWEDLFKGSRGGAVVIPFSPEFSTLAYYTNSFPEYGPALVPRMPLNAPALSREEFLTLRDWIQAGAPDRNGKVKFRDKPGRRKIYIANRLCDMVTVIDAGSQLAMACVNVGSLPKTEFPVCLRVSPDRQSWYCTFLASAKLQKFSAVSDSYVSEADLGPGVWQDFVISGDSRFAFCADRSGKGRIAKVDLQEMKVVRYYESDLLVYPNSILLEKDGSKIYTGTETGNFVTRVDISNEDQVTYEWISLNGAVPEADPALSTAALAQYTLTGRCFMALKTQGELVAFDPKTDAVTGRLQLRAAPTAAAIDHERSALFISCMDDSLSFPGHAGTVQLISPAELRVTRTLRAGYQSSGLCVVPEAGCLAVVNSNISPKGPGPHHTGACAGRNGYVTFVDLETLELLPGRRFELAVYPFSAAGR